MKFFDGITDMFSKYVGIDLGTANTVVYVKGKGIVLRESSVVAIDLDTNTVLAVGEDAKQMIGRTPGNIVAIRPLREGVIADFDVTHKMLKYFIEKAIPNKTFLTSTRVIVGVPGGVTEVEKKAVIDAVMDSGAKEALILEEPMAAAIGSNLPVDQPTGSMVVDIGGGTTEIAVISLGGIVTNKSLRIAGDELDNSIINYIKREYSLVIGERTAEAVKINIGSAYPMQDEEKMQVIGRNLVTGLPHTMTVTSTEILEAMKEPISNIIEGIKYTLERTPPELSSDIMLHGIMLTGGGANLRGLNKLIEAETHMPVHIAEEALDCVALGAGKAIESYETLKSVFTRQKRMR